MIFTIWLHGLCFISIWMTNFPESYVLIYSARHQCSAKWRTSIIWYSYLRLNYIGNAELLPILFPHPINGIVQNLDPFNIKRYFRDTVMGLSKVNYFDDPITNDHDSNVMEVSMDNIMSVDIPNCTFNPLQNIFSHIMSFSIKLITVNKKGQVYSIEVFQVNYECLLIKVVTIYSNDIYLLDLVLLRLL